jgi:hypothetical protein
MIKPNLLKGWNGKPQVLNEDNWFSIIKAELPNER